MRRCGCSSARPRFVAAVVLPMALALGANTALFSVIRGVLLRPLPYAQPERLVRIRRVSPGNPGRGGPLSALNYTEDLAATPSLERKALWVVQEMSLAGDGPAEHIRAGVGTASLLPVLGLQPALGRWFSPDEEVQGQNHRIVLSHALWLRRFGGDPAALGRTLLVDGEPHVVVGVLPAGIELPELCDLWVPLSFEPMQLQPGARNWHYLPGGGAARSGEHARVRPARAGGHLPADDRGPPGGLQVVPVRLHPDPLPGGHRPLRPSRA